MKQLYSLCALLAARQRQVFPAFLPLRLTVFCVRMCILTSPSDISVPGTFCREVYRARVYRINAVRSAGKRLQYARCLRGGFFKVPPRLPLPATAAIYRVACS